MDLSSYQIWVLSSPVGTADWSAQVCRRNSNVLTKRALRVPYVKRCVSECLSRVGNWMWSGMGDDVCLRNVVTSRFYLHVVENGDIRCTRWAFKTKRKSGSKQVLNVLNKSVFMRVCSDLFFFCLQCQWFKGVLISCGNFIWQALIELVVYVGTCLSLKIKQQTIY